MKKTVATMALSASTSAFALMPLPIEMKKVCLEAFEANEGALYAGICDQSENNAILGLEILENGCAQNQIAITATKLFDDNEWYPAIHACMPPNVVQL